MTDPDDACYAGYVDEESSVGDTVTVPLERGDDRTTVRTATNADGGSERVATQNIGCIVSEFDRPERSGIESRTPDRNAHPGPPFVPFPGIGGEGEITP